MKKVILWISLIVPLLLTGITDVATAQGNNKELKSRVQNALNSYFMHQLFVNIDDGGIVTIKGDVDALYDKLDIYQIISQVKGVTKIKDLVNVNTPTMPDDIINVNISRAIKDNSVILEPDRISVAVTSGLVILTGTVSYYKEKLVATSVASMQDGVKGVDNEIAVLPFQKEISDDNIKEILSEIIENHFPLINGKVSCKVINGDVAVEGAVRNLWEKEHLKEEFCQVTGVKSVIENLVVKPEY
jgi:osmotically-inducible protein OsmY